MISYKYKLVTNHTSWLTAGTISIVDDRVYLGEYPFSEFLKQFEEMHVEIAVAPMVECGIPFDEKIKPLVDVINAYFKKIGEFNGHTVKTIASCEGHLGNALLKPFPWVAFNGKVDYLQYGFFPPDCKGWKLDYFDRGMHIPIWRTKEEATTPEELKELQEKISELSKTFVI